MSVPVSVSVCVCVCVPVWVGSRSHRILPTSSLFASAQHNYLNKNTKIQKEIRKPPLSLPPKFCYIKYKNTTTFNQSENLFSFYHYSECTESVTMTLVLKLRDDCSKNGSHIHNYFNIVALVLCAPFTFV